LATEQGVRVGFLFNHAAGHQVAHALPIAAAMARDHRDVELRIFVTPGLIEVEVRRLWAAEGQPFNDERVECLALPSRGARWLTALSGGAVPADRLSILSRNLARFAECDALVVPEKTSALLKTRFGLKTALIHTRHGAGDRAIGFDKASSRFDLVLLSGPKIRDRLAQAGLLKPDGYAIVGYPKFDLPPGKPSAPLFDKPRPTVLYNPHPSPSLSSWYRMGPAVLDWFADQDRFNLIFAPHVMLFAKRLTIGLKPFSIARVPQIPERAYAAPNIHIDTGSPALFDMTYTALADIYLGDVSSQVYEFLRRPRPCVFLDPADRAWRGNPDFTHWQVGPVAHSVEEMSEALSASLADPDRYADTQTQLFAYSFDLTGPPSARRAADAIVEWLGRHTQKPRRR
jgi:hypothetical protein